MNTNQGVIVGNLVRDPETKKIESTGMAICDITVAVNGMKDDDVSFIDVTAFGKTADAISKYTSKGSKVAVTYYLKQERWENKEGQKRSRLKCNATRVEFLSSSEKVKVDNSEDEFSGIDEDDIFEPTDDDMDSEIPF